MPTDTSACLTPCLTPDMSLALLVPILAHLDLDAFFAAVEELENPELRDKPLVVGGDPHGRGVVSTANYAARQFGIHSAMSAAEALRRCPTRRVPAPTARALPPVLARRMGHRRGDRPARRAHRDRRGLPRPRHRRAGLHARPRDRVSDPDRGPRVARASRARSASEPRRSSARSHPTGASRAGSRSCLLARRLGSSHRSPVRLLPGVGPRAEARLRPAGVETIGALASARRRRAAHAPSRFARTAPARPRAGNRPARPRPRARAGLGLGGGHVHARPDRPRAPARRGAAAGGARLGAPAQLRACPGAP